MKEVVFEHFNLTEEKLSKYWIQTNQKLDVITVYAKNSDNKLDYLIEKVEVLEKRTNNLTLTSQNEIDAMKRLQDFTNPSFNPEFFNLKAKRNFSTPDFSSMSLSSPDISTLDFSTLNSSTRNFSTINFSTPKPKENFQPQNFQPQTFYSTSTIEKEDTDPLTSNQAESCSDESQATNSNHIESNLGMCCINFQSYTIQIYILYDFFYYF